MVDPQKSHWVLSVVPLCCRLYCNKWLLFLAKKVFLRVTFDRWHSRSKFPSRASVVPRVTFDLDLHQWARHNYHSTQQKKRRNSANNRVGFLASRTFDLPAVMQFPIIIIIVITMYMDIDALYKVSLDVQDIFIMSYRKKLKKKKK